MIRIKLIIFCNLKALTIYLSEVSGSTEIRKLHHLVLGNHGSEWSGLLNMSCAHAHMSLNSRYRIAEIIQISYEMCLANNSLTEPSNVSANRTLLLNSIASAKTASINHKSGYTVGVLDGDINKISAVLVKNVKKDSNISNSYIAKALGRTERTIKNWENTTEPSFLDLCYLYYILEKPIWPYIRNALYSAEPINLSEQDKLLQKELIEYFQKAEISETRKMCYLIFGGHGSNWSSLLEMMFEHSCTSLFQRVISARSVLIGYQMDQSHEELNGLDHIFPDISVLENCIKLGTYAAKNGLNSYTDLDKNAVL